jgi:Ceramidase
MRELAVAIGFSLFVLVPFLIFVGAGWPGKQSSCVTETDGGKVANTCYCESFRAADIGKPGVRQPFNTWSNLYSLVTGGVLAFVVYWHRRNGLPAGPNRMASTDFYPLVYIAVVIFLGLGSMWFHASLTEWGGVFDNASMYTFTNFIVFYTITRMTDVDLIFYIGYPLSTVLLILTAALGAKSFIVVLFSVGAYAVLEATIAFFMPHVRNTRDAWLYYWLPGVGSILTATVVWTLSQTGGRLCLDTHAFQFHGLWHWLAGATALCLYFFWRAAPR